MPDEDYHSIRIRGKKHPMKKNRVWSWYTILRSDGSKVFAIFSMNNINLDNLGGF